ncbi:aerobic-type carbon monoxide dehydrogenase, middle subunit CoxM/CutM-like protein [Mycobacterium lentiflavum]|uniref:Aerobic-type carbon monoxide dehydrogenase, middle subunit CoxM/CutM-like protein n=1 Tax=Mycobacterium lentiflavum TaxID=141349 RepID=A0A0E4GZQ6_MYCLN|nr:FAD binding domain-containing protein [Mycobacterium lentiflavum]CQD16859.1 aerobic-type carbon monoxide dehydrogenase, middle subunit CoxM/CutM-like protein [Mycobacterium lentiflavum]
MDLNTVVDVVRRPSDRPGAAWRTGDAWLAGGTWLFSQPQPAVNRLVDLAGLGWPSLVSNSEGLEIAATCTVRELYEFVPPDDWLAGGLLQTSCEMFLAPLKVWNAATVGGNICMSLPAGPMITMAVALQATYLLWAADGTERTVAAKDFVIGDHQNVLGPGEILRSVHVPEHSLGRRYTYRRFTLTKLGRSTVFLVATQTPGADDLMLTITAATTHPLVLEFGTVPDADTLQRLVDAIPTEFWFADPNGTPAHRRHLTKHYAEEIRAELGGTR